MTNEEKLRQIREEASRAPVPDSLSPDQIRRMLEEDGERIRMAYRDDPDLPEDFDLPEEAPAKKKGGGKRAPVLVFSLAAAAALFAAAGLPLLQAGRNVSSTVPVEMAAAQEAPAEAEAAVDAEGAEDPFLAYAAPAASYEDIYTRLKDSGLGGYMAYVEDGVVMEAAEAEAAAPSDGFRKEAAANETGTAYSETNQREEDVAEGDIVKTDGRCIYSCADRDRLAIILADRDKLAEAAVIPAEEGGEFREFYVQEEKLVLVEQVCLPQLTENAENVYRLDTGTKTRVLTYDISDPASPVLQGTLTVSGRYDSSRIHAGHLYLMTWDDAVLSAASAGLFSGDYREETFLSEGVLPSIGGQVLEAGDIYLPKEPGWAPTLLISSMDLQDPSAAKDAKAVMACSEWIYVSAQAIYLEIPAWRGDGACTDILKIGCRDGMITPAAALSVRGELCDSFSIDESEDGHLRLAVTDWSGMETENAVYIYDGDLKKTGALTGLAGGETIRSCRFIGDLCYLVTFRNTDPLFTIDLSDPASPAVLSELKVSGFSEYLHPWGEDALVGLGRDADEETGSVRGLKLSLFDISDPAGAAEKDRLILEGTAWSPAENEYRALLVSPVRGLIGFAAASDYGYGGTGRGAYLVFACRDKKLTKLAALPLTGADLEKVRGLYIGETFYLAEEKKITAYAMEGFEKLTELAY